MLWDYENETLNFDSGEVPETILLYNIDEGLIIELIDSECSSKFFYYLVEKFKDFKSHHNIQEEFLFFELAHMSNKVSKLIDVEKGSVFLNILKRNNILF